MLNPTLRALEGVLRLHRCGKLKGPLAQYVIDQASYYAKRNNLPFDGSLKSALHLAEEADRTVRDHMTKMAYQQELAQLEEERRRARRVIVVSKGC